MTRFTGVWPALMTPLTDEDRINVPVTRRVMGTGVSWTSE